MYQAPTPLFSVGSKVIRLRHARGGAGNEARLEQGGGRTRFSGYVTITRIYVCIVYVRRYAWNVSCRAGRLDDLTSAVSLWRGSGARAKALA